MENLYKIGVEEYPDELPNPKHFPIQGATIIAIRGKPYAFSDGFILDLLVRETDKKVLEGRVIRTVDTSAGIGTFLKEAMVSKLLLSEPEFIYNTSYLTYIVFTPEGNPVVIQVKYYRYFRNRYKECNFYIRDDKSTAIIAIKVGEEVVGLCMPIFLERITFEKIIEERKCEESNG